ncbi:CheY-like chemotaxis protein [Bradyrhizobium sp. USDA 4516]
MPMALVVAARPYLTELWQAVDQSRIQVVPAEFEHTVSLAAQHQPDLILIASPPIADVLETCQRLLESSSTRNIPIFLIPVDYSLSDGSPSAPRATTVKFPYWLEEQCVKEGDARDRGQSMVSNPRQTQLLSILDLLRYAEAEVAELDIETSVALLAATIADITQHLT